MRRAGTSVSEPSSSLPLLARSLPLAPRLELELLEEVDELLRERGMGERRQQLSEEPKGDTGVSADERERAVPRE